MRTWRLLKLIYNAKKKFGEAKREYERSALVQWLGWVFEPQERKKERKNISFTIWTGLSKNLILGCFCTNWASADAARVRALYFGKSVNHTTRIANHWHAKLSGMCLAYSVITRTISLRDRCALSLELVSMLRGFHSTPSCTYHVSPVSSKQCCPSQHHSEVGGYPFPSVTRLSWTLCYCVPLGRVMSRFICTYVWM